MNGQTLSLILAVASLASLAGCDDADKPTSSAPRARSQAVIAPVGSVAQKVDAAGTEGAGEGGAKEAKPPRALCKPRTGKERRRVAADSQISRAAAPGETALGVRLPIGSGSADSKVLWVNFWAAWCVPCKEEIPRLLAWEKTLNQEGTPFEVLFVSLDDDERQLRDFLEKQSAEGLRRTYWLREGSQREEWLAKVGMDTDPRLPVHLVVSAQGETHCVIDGAVEDDDLPEVRKLVSSASGQ